MIDTVAQRYGVRPSQLRDGTCGDFAFDLACREAGLRAAARAGETGKALPVVILGGV